MIPGAPRGVAASLGRYAGLDLHLAQLRWVKRRPAESIVLVAAQQMPNDDRDLAGRRDRGDLLPTPSFDAKEECVKRPGCGRRGPGRLDQKPAGQRAALLGDAAVVGTAIACLTALTRKHTAGSS